MVKQITNWDENLPGGGHVTITGIREKRLATNPMGLPKAMHSLGVIVLFAIAIGAIALPLWVAIITVCVRIAQAWGWL